MPTADGRWSPTDAAVAMVARRAHGGPSAALLARAVEPLLDPLLPVRLTVELLRAVLVAPLTVEVEDCVRPQGPDGRARLLHDGTVVASATALAIRLDDVDVPEQPVGRCLPSLGEGATLISDVNGYSAFHNDGVEHRFVAGSFVEAGPATDWIRLRVPVVPDEEPSGLQRVAAAATSATGSAG